MCVCVLLPIYRTTWCSRFISSNQVILKMPLAANVAEAIVLAWSVPAVALVLGVVQRVSPIRALVFGLRSRFSQSATRTSQRAEEIARVRAWLTIAGKGFYTTVEGQKGIGKSCIVDTALAERMHGVAVVEVPPGTKKQEIITKVRLEITNRSFDSAYGAECVLFWHRIFFWRPATVVLRAGERKANQPFSDVDHAARSLAEHHGNRLRVIIDASDNSLPVNNRSFREIAVEVGPASRDVIESMPNLETLHKALKAAGLADVVWACVGGVPAQYASLDGQWRAAGGEEGGKLEAVVEWFLQDRLDSAIRNVSTSCAKDLRFKEIYALFRTQNKVFSSVFHEFGLVRSSSDNVLRLVQHGVRLIPVDAATAVVLRFPDVMAERAPGLQKLKDLLCKGECVWHTGSHDDDN